MILEAIFTLISILIRFVFSLLPDVPSLDESVTTAISSYIDLITSNLTFLSFFIDVSYFKILVIALIALIGFRYSFKFIMWIYHKLPFSSE